MMLDEYRKALTEHVQCVPFEPFIVPPFSALPPDALPVELLPLDELLPDLPCLFFLREEEVPVRCFCDSMDLSCAELPAWEAFGVVCPGFWPTALPPVLIPPLGSAALPPLVSCAKTAPEVATAASANRTIIFFMLHINKHLVKSATPASEGERRIDCIILSIKALEAVN
ncbi:hypothetical protein ISP15_11870 [Dyella jejuensis]|uniref:Uncharacterized protein n=1 Tax=Dyella jejuensis TaxID=1432009 RepID=A0ABW8JIV0_9GAMM